MCVCFSFQLAVVAEGCHSFSIYFKVYRTKTISVKASFYARLLGDLKVCFLRLDFSLMLYCEN